MNDTFTAAIWREDDGYVALCAELDIASQGDTVEAARANLKEAVELFFECASPTEIGRRFNREVYINTFAKFEGVIEGKLLKTQVVENRQKPAGVCVFLQIFADFASGQARPCVSLRCPA